MMEGDLVLPAVRSFLPSVPGAGRDEWRNPNRGRSALNAPQNEARMNVGNFMYEVLVGFLFLRGVHNPRNGTVRVQADVVCRVQSLYLRYREARPHKEEGVPHRDDSGPWVVGGSLTLSRKGWGLGKEFKGTHPSV